MQDRRQEIIKAGLETLREHGYVGFTQPRVAARAGMRQSHLTYYHPTRLDLLTAVFRAAVDRQLVAVDAILGGHTTPAEAARAIAAVVVRHENTRVFMALAQAGDEEPQLRELFRELADGFASRIASMLRRLANPVAVETHARLMHALIVGLAVVDLATGRPDGMQRAAGILEAALQPIAGGIKPSKRPPRAALQKGEPT